MPIEFPIDEDKDDLKYWTVNNKEKSFIVDSTKE